MATSNIVNYSNIRTIKTTDFSKSTFTSVNIKTLAKDGSFLLLNKNTGLYEQITENTTIGYQEILNGELKYVSPNIKLAGYDYIDYVIDNSLTTNRLNIVKINVDIGTISETQIEIIGNLYSNKIVGNDMDNIIYALNGNDTVQAGLGNDTIYGGSGNDIIDGGLGNDIMYGEYGNDTYIVDSVDDVIVEKLYQGIDTVKTNISYTLGDNLENLNLENSINDLIGKGNSSSNIIIGGNGNDELYGEIGNDKLYGGIGNDTLYGGEGNDILYGGEGDDTLQGGIGNDVYYVEQGDIVIEGINEGIDRVETNASIEIGDNIEDITLVGKIGLSATGNNLNNKIIGTYGNDTLNGELGNDTLSGGTGNDTLNGGEGNDILISGIGADILNGGNGDDVYYIENTGDIITENLNEGTDIVYSEISYTLLDNIENLVVKNSIFNIKPVNSTGNNLDNTIIGGYATDNINGLEGNDTLYGGSGNDNLNGGIGNNILYGGAGKDNFIFNSELTFFTDSIKDFNVKDDTLFLENSIFTNLNINGILNSSMFKANVDGVATDANDYLIYETDTGKLFYDADGNGNELSIQIATIENKTALTYQDFLVI